MARKLMEQVNPIAEKPVKRMMLLWPGEQGAVQERVVISRVQGSEGSTEMRMKIEYPI